MHGSNARLGPIVLADGVRPVHALSFLYSTFAILSACTFISVIQPYVLNVNIGVPMADQGRVSGNMVFYGEIVLLTLSGLAGALSDRLGRKTVFLAGVIILGLGYVLYGYVSSVGQLTLVRIFLALGITSATVMISAIQVDYPAEESRGKLVGIAACFIGIGAVLIGVLGQQLPYWFVSAGATPQTMLTLSSVCAISLLILGLGLIGGRPPYAEDRKPMAQLLAEGLKAARKNRRVLLAYAAAFVARGDLVVVGTFFTLWLTQEGIGRGLAVDEAQRQAGLFFGMVMAVALVWAPIMGIINDRLDRTRVMALALLSAAAGYVVMGLIPDPLGVWMYPAGVLLGIGQLSVVSASQTLIGQEAPRAVRGSVVGTFSICGAAGILFITSVGGRMYDAIAPSAPFVLIGVVNLALGLAALFIRSGGSFSGRTQNVQ